MFVDGGKFDASEVKFDKRKFLGKKRIAWINASNLKTQIYIFKMRVSVDKIWSRNLQIWLQILNTKS